MDSSHPLINGAEIIDGQFVSAEVRRIVDAIRDYSPDIQVHWIPPAVREEGQAAYRIVHFPVGQEPYIITTVRRDEDMTLEVVKDLIAGDQRNGAVSWSEFEAWEKANELVGKQKFLDTLEEAHDMAAHALRSRLHNYKITEDIIIRDRGGLI